MKYINATAFLALECAIKESVRKATRTYRGCIMKIENEEFLVTETNIHRLLKLYKDHSIHYRVSYNDCWIGEHQQLWCTSMSDRTSISLKDLSEIIATSKHTSATWQCTNDPSWWGKKDPELGPYDVIHYGSWCGMGCTDQMHVIRFKYKELADMDRNGLLY